MSLPVDWRGAAMPPFISRIREWAERQPGVRALVLVGSHARCEARPDSDVDIVMLVASHDDFLETHREWLQSIGVYSQASREPYGRVTSLRFSDGECVIELSIAPADWASEPVDAGTERVARHGFVVFFDRDGHATRLQERLHPRL